VLDTAVARGAIAMDERRVWRGRLRREYDAVADILGLAFECRFDAPVVSPDPWKARSNREDQRATLDLWRRRWSRSCWLLTDG